MAAAFFATTSALLLLARAGSAVAGGGDCAGNPDLSSQLSIESRRNATGHWESKVEMTHSDEGGVEEEPWKVDVRQVSTDCNSGGPGFVHVAATLVSPRAASIIPQGKEYVFLAPVVGEEGYYALSTTKAKWAEARAVCRRRGADLLVVDSAKEEAAVMGLLRRLPATIYTDSVAHIGAHDRGHEGNYVTVKGQPLSYVRWAPGNPGAPYHSSDVEDCGGIDNQGRMHDVPCEDELKFICENARTTS